MIFNHANAALLVIVLRAGLASAAAGGGGVPQRNDDAASGGGVGTIRKKKAAALAPKRASAEKVAAMTSAEEHRGGDGGDDHRGGDGGDDHRGGDGGDEGWGDRDILLVEDELHVEEYTEKEYTEKDSINALIPKIVELNSIYVEWTDDEIAALCAKYKGGEGEGECASFFLMGCGHITENAAACAEVLELVDYLDQPDPNNSECEQFFECEPNDEGKPNGGKKLVGMCKGVVACREKGKNCEKLEAKWEEKMHECKDNSRLFSEEDLALVAVKYPVVKNDDLMLKESSP